MKKVIMAVIVAFFGLSLIGISSANAGDRECPGTGTPGYWMNHPDEWPVDVIILPSDGEPYHIVYTKEQAIELMKAPVKGDKSLTMFPAYVAALLNVRNGCCGPRFCLYEAHWWLGEFPPESGVRGNSEAWRYSHGEQIYLCLDDYNNGEGCAPSRDALEL